THRSPVPRGVDQLRPRADNRGCQQRCLAHDSEKRIPVFEMPIRRKGISHSIASRNTRTKPAVSALGRSRWAPLPLSLTQRTRIHRCYSRYLLGGKSRENGGWVTNFAGS